MFATRLIYAVVSGLIGTYLAIPFLALRFGAELPTPITAYQPSQYFILGCLLVSMAFLTILSALLGVPRHLTVPKDSILFHEYLDQLRSNYDLLRNQMQVGFRVAAFFVVIGMLIILAGVLASFGLLDKWLGRDLASFGPVTTASGVVIDLMSGIGFYLFKINFERLNLVSDRLSAMLRIEQLFERTQKVADETKRDAMTIELTRRIIYGEGKRTNIMPQQ